MAINSTSWKRMPVADRDQEFSADMAFKRIQEWASASAERFNSSYLWSNPQGSPGAKDTYRLPIADIMDGKQYLIPHAVFTAAAILSGAHGGLVGVITDEESLKLKGVVTEIYDVLAQRFGDPRIKPPWLRGGNNVEDVTAAIEPDTQTDPAEAAMGDEDVTVAAAAPVAPPRQWFNDPGLNMPTPIVVTADGRVFGHLAAWGVCHASFGNRCVMAPRTATDYKYFLNGSVLTSDGSMVKIGKITLGTGHADIRLGWIPAAEHYDNTGTQAAVVAAGEDRHGIWVAGAMVPEADDETAAQLRRSPLSGDWRRVGGNLELVAALAVNTPGFPIVSLNASGEPDSLCATGVVLEDGSIMAAGDEAPEPTSEPDRRALDRLAKVQGYVDSLERDRRNRRFWQVMGGK